MCVVSPKNSSQVYHRQPAQASIETTITRNADPPVHHAAKRRVAAPVNYTENRLIVPIFPIVTVTSITPITPVMAITTVAPIIPAFSTVVTTVNGPSLRLDPTATRITANNRTRCRPDGASYNRTTSPAYVITHRRAGSATDSPSDNGPALRIIGTCCQQ